MEEQNTLFIDLFKLTTYLFSRHYHNLKKKGGPVTYLESYLSIHASVNMVKMVGRDCISMEHQ